MSRKIFDRAAIFPLQPGTKEPLRGTRGFHDAICNAIIPQGYNIGCVPASVGLICIDLDPGYDEAWELEHLPPTLTVKSPRGWHLYYRCNERFGNGPLGKHIDIRSAGGYSILPPSRLADGSTYEWADEREPVALPETVLGLLRAKREHDNRPHDPDIDGGDDNKSNLTKARMMLQSTNPNDNGYNIACRLRRDIGLSHAAAVEIFTEWSDTLDWPWDYEKIWSVCRNAGRYGNGARGQFAGAGPEAYQNHLRINGINPDDPILRIKTEKPSGRFKGRKPSEGRNLPELAYFDEERTFPKVPGGASLIVVGPKSTHKTGLVMKKCLDAAEKGAKVLFIAAEGGHGLEKMRLPTAIDTRWGTFEENWITISSSFNMFSDAEELIAEHQQWSPDIVVIDTLTRGTGGADINAPNVGSAIHHAADKIATAFDALVVLIHHPKHGGTVSLGSVLIDSLAYAVWHTSKQSADQIRCWVDKMKDGPAEFEVLYRINLENGTPIIENDTRQKQERKRNPHSGEVRDYVEQILKSAVEPINFATLLDLLRPYNISGDTLENHVRGKTSKGQTRVLPDIRPFVSPDRDGHIAKRRDAWVFLPLGTSGDIP